MISGLSMGDTVQIEIQSLASEMANYDAWANYEDARVNIQGRVNEGDTVVVRILDYEGGSYFARPVEYVNDNDIAGSKNDLINDHL